MVLIINCNEQILTKSHIQLTLPDKTAEYHMKQFHHLENMDKNRFINRFYQNFPEGRIKGM
jgi:hypothetical protein